MPKSMIEIGWEEWIALPDLNLPAIRAKVDTGARTSALHAFMVEKIVEEGITKVRFGIHPIPQKPEIEVYCIAHLIDERAIISSNGQTELRYVIRTMAEFGEKKWPIEITLTDRETMAYRMLIGRQAMEGKLTVLPGRSFLLGELDPNVYEHIVRKRKKKKLKILILSGARQSYSKDRLVASALARGHQVEIINPTRCYVHITGNKPTIHYQGHVLDRFDSVIPRIGSSITFYGVAILRQFEALGTYCLNSSLGISHARDRLFAHQLLSRAGIAMPATTFAHYPGDTKHMIKSLGGAPLVIKLLEGQEGRGVVVAETNKAAEAVIQAFRGLKANFIAQEYIHDGKTKDVRCLVLGRKVIGAVEVIHDGEALTPDQFRAIELTITERKLAIKAAKVLGLKFAGVNLFRSRQITRVVDVNSSPTLKHLEYATQEDLATQIIEYLEHHARPRLPKRTIGYSH